MQKSTNPQAKVIAAPDEPPSVTIPSNSRLVSLFRRYSRGASAIGILVGASVLVGWLFDILFLKSVIPGLVTIKANAALCFILAGVALGLLENEAATAGMVVEIVTAVDRAGQPIGD